MSDDLKSVFDGVTGRVVIPPGHLHAVVRGGRRRRRHRAAAALVGSALVAAAAWGVAANVRPVSEPPRPAASGGADFALVPDETLGPEPGPDLADEAALAEARALTVAFHALVLRVPYYEFGYEGVRADGDSWEVTFSDGGGPSAEERLTQAEIDALEQAAAILAERRQELRPRERRLREQLRETTGKVRSRAAVVVPASVRQIEGAQADLHRHLQRLQERLREEQLAGEWHPVLLRVVEENGGLVVEGVETASPQKEMLEAVVGYGEPVDGIDSWGADYFGLDLHRSGEHGLLAEMNVFWTGPIPGRYEELCVPEVRDASGKVVWIGDETRLHYMATPPNDDRRESALSFGVDYDGPPEGLEMEMECSWRPSF